MALIHGFKKVPNMDAILDVCFDEGLFNTPLHHSKRTKEKEIPTRNPYRFSNTLHPLYEIQNLSKEGLVSLCCRATHEIQPRNPDIKENDTLYAAFAFKLGGDVAFMQTWLHLSVCMHHKYFTRLGTKYFDSKSLMLDTWMDGIIEGHTGDTLVLHGLCLLVESHAGVYLKDNKIWTRLKAPPNDHDTAMDQCNIHLTYLGWGMFATLHEREAPLRVIPSDGDTKPVILGSLSPMEYLTVNKLTLATLGVRLRRPRSRLVSSTISNPSNASTSSVPPSAPILIEPLDHTDPCLLIPSLSPLLKQCRNR